MQDLLQVHYQTLPINSLKEVKELNVNSDTMIKNVKHVKLKYYDCFLESINLKDELIKHNMFLVTKFVNASLTKS